MPTAKRSQREVFERLTTVEQKQDASDAKLDEISKDVKSLLESRSFTRGVVKMAMVVAGIVSAAVSVLVTFLRGPSH